MNLKPILSFAFSIAMALVIPHSTIQSQTSFDFSFEGINGNCSSLTFSVSNFDPNVVLVAVFDADTDFLFGSSFQDYTFNVTGCTRSFRFVTFYDDNTTLTETLFAPPFLFTGVPSIIEPTLFNPTSTVTIGATRCVQPADWVVTYQPIN